MVNELAAQNPDQKMAAYSVMLNAFFGETNIVTGNETLDSLLSAGGMHGMLGTIWLILTAMIFGGLMDASGFLRRITQAVVNAARTTGQLVAATVGTCLLTNVTASDQYLSVIVPGQMYRDAYKDRGLASQNLSRTLEDSGTVTSVLVPWNTCGAYHAGVLSVATTSYLPFAIFCLVSPVMSVIYASRNIRIARTSDVSEVSDENNQPAPA